MKTKILLMCSVLLISFNTATKAQTTDWEIYNTNNSPLVGNSVTAVKTIGNNAWIGTTAGTNYFNGTSWTTLTTQNTSLPDNHVNDIAREENGALWFATENGLAKLHDHEWTVYNSTNSGLPVNIIRCITIHSNGNIWVGTFNNGIGVLENNNWMTYNTDNSALQSNEVKSIAFDKNHNTWIASANGIVRVNGNVWTFINHAITGFSFQTVNDIVCDDNIFFASDNGVIEFDGTHWISHRADNSSLPVNDVRAVAIDDKQNLWIATAGGGLTIYNDNGVALSIQDAQTAANTLNVFPNPANGEAKFNFTTTESGKAELALYDIQGRKVCTLLNEEVGAGKHEVKFDTNTLPAGIYIWWVRFKDRIDTMRLAVI